MKMVQGPLSRITENFKMATAEHQTACLLLVRLCAPPWVTSPRSWPYSAFSKHDVVGLDKILVTGSHSWYPDSHLLALKGEVHLWVDRVQEIVEIFLEGFDSFLSQTNMFTSFPFWKAFCRCFFRIEVGFGKRNKGWGECEHPSLESWGVMRNWNRGWSCFLFQSQIWWEEGLCSCFVFRDFYMFGTF